MSMCIEAWKALESTRQAEVHAVVNAEGRIVALRTIHGPIPYPGILVWARFNQCDHEFTQILAWVIQYVDFERTRRIHNELANQGR